MPIPARTTVLNRLATRIAIAAGRIITAETNNAPAIGMMTAIVTPVNALKTSDMTLNR